MAKEAEGDNLESEVVEQVEAEEGDVATPELTVEDRIGLLQLQLQSTIEEKDRHWQSVAQRAEEAQKEARKAKQELTRWQQVAQDAQQELVFARQQPDLSGLDPEEQRIKKLEMQSQAALAELQRLKQERTIASQPIYMRMPREVQMMVIDQDVELDDSRIDWALDETDYPSAIKRIRGSLKNIKAEDAAKKEEQAQASLEEAKEHLRAERGRVETVDVETPGVPAKTRKLEDIEQAFIDGNIDAAEYAKARKEAGID